jgi:hypothetical protein
MWRDNFTNWEHSSYKLSAFSGETDPIQFRFVFESDKAITSKDGWAIDNFKINLPAVANDVRVESVLTSSSVQTGSAVKISVLIKNDGTATQTTFPVSYSVDGSAPVTETYVASGIGLKADSSEVFIFNATFAAPSVDFNLCSFTGLVGDSYPINDTACKTVNVTLANLDAAITDINVDPEWNDTTKRSMEPKVMLTIYNAGLDTLTSIPVEYVVDGTTVSETWTGSLTSNKFVVYTFSQTYESPYGSYPVCAKVKLVNDANASNDSLCKSYFGIPDVGFENSNKLAFTVNQNIPNPAAGITRINFSIPQAGRVNFELHNALGQIVISSEESYLVEDNIIEINTAEFSNGIYYYTIEYGHERITMKMVVNQ